MTVVPRVIKQQEWKSEQGNQMKLKKNTNIRPPETKMTIGTRMEKAKPGTKIRQQQEQQFEHETIASSGSQINATKLERLRRNVARNGNDSHTKSCKGTRMEIGTRKPDDIEEEYEYLVYLHRY